MAEQKTIDKIVKNPATFNITLGLIVSGSAVAATWEIYHLFKKHALNTALAELEEHGLGEFLNQEDILKFFAEDRERKNRLETPGKILNAITAKDGHLRLVDLAEKTRRYQDVRLHVKDLLKEIDVEGGVPELAGMKLSRQRLALAHLNNSADQFFENLENCMRFHVRGQGYETALEKAPEDYLEDAPDKILYIRKAGKRKVELTGKAPLFISPGTRKKIEIGTFEMIPEATSDTVLAGFFRIMDVADENKASLVVFNRGRNKDSVNEALNVVIPMFGRDRILLAGTSTKQVVRFNPRSFFHKPPTV